MSPNSPDTDPNAVAVATGDRHEEVHFEADPGQLVVARHLVKPDRLPPDMQPNDWVESERDVPSVADAPPVEDVLVAPDAPSVWDARPPAEGAD